MWAGVAPDVRRLLLCRELIRWAWLVTDQEVCGLLYEDGPHIIPNVARNKLIEYQMEPEEQFRLMSARGWPEAIFHTHPGGTREPSSLDHRSALQGVPYVIAVPSGWAGVWVDGEPIMEVTMSPGTNDLVEVYQDKSEKWRWRRTASNGAVISGSEESFDSKANAARAAQRANPDAFDNATTPETSAAGDTVDAGGGAGAGGGTGTVGPVTGGPGANSSGVGPTGGAGI